MITSNKQEKVFEINASKLQTRYECAKNTLIVPIITTGPITEDKWKQLIAKERRYRRSALAGSVHN
jgi:hypothetical protein|tara:strand:+ start:2674 stop:2871 length:198 start_codon:yes stop_codon:yes gene_type:complete